MISIDALRDDREEAYKVWFERWWARADIEREIINANSRGFTFIKIDLDNGDAYTRNRMNDSLFIENLKDKLPGFRLETNLRVSQQLLRKDKVIKELFINWDDDGEDMVE